MSKQETKVIDIDTKKERLTADGQSVLPHITLNIVPVAKPRMTQSDKWKKRPVVQKYWKYKDDLKLLCFLCRWQIILISYYFYNFLNFCLYNLIYLSYYFWVNFYQIPDA